MNQQENINFFNYLGEIWRDITAIEFLMRCAIAKKDGDINKLPKPPYKKGDVYLDYPKSFSHFSFEVISKKFSKRYPKLTIPSELVALRDAMAHGLIAEVDKSGITELIKFKEEKEKKSLSVEFSMTLEMERLAQIKQSLMELRNYIISEVDENNKK